MFFFPNKSYLTPPMKRLHQIFIVLGNGLTFGPYSKPFHITGEMIVGPTKTLFMDEISTGLDSSTTFQIVKCLQQIVHLTEATIFMSLLQPAPETFDLFDDIVLLSEGQIVYQGPREHVVEFFESCGFKCPERKGTADFLQEVFTNLLQPFVLHKKKNTHI